MLVGLPELRDRLALRRNRSLHSRLHHRLEIAPLTPDDTAEYLRLRLRRAGCERELFADLTPDAIAIAIAPGTGTDAMGIGVPDHAAQRADAHRVAASAPGATTMPIDEAASMPISRRAQ